MNARVAIRAIIGPVLFPMLSLRYLAVRHDPAYLAGWLDAYPASHLRALLRCSSVTVLQLKVAPTPSLLEYRTGAARLARQFGLDPELLSALLGEALPIGTLCASSLMALLAR